MTYEHEQQFAYRLRVIRYAAQLAAVRNRLSDTLRAVGPFYGHDPDAALIVALKTEIEELEHRQVRSNVNRVLTNPRWYERTAFWGLVFWESLVQYAKPDRFLRIAIAGGLLGAVVSLAQLLGWGWNVLAILGSLGEIAVPSAFAQGVENALVTKDIVRGVVLFSITVGFFLALAILGFSNKTDSRKFAADMIKTILGVYIGMATKFMD